MSASSHPFSPLRFSDVNENRELLLITGLTQHGVGNWKRIAEHLGTRTKEEAEQHYTKVYIESPDWPLPVSIFNVLTS